MPRNKEELSKHTLNLFTGDYAKMQSYYPDIGAGAAIRRLIRSFIEKVEENGEVSDANVEIKL